MPEFVRVLGIDCGTRCLGFGVIDSDGYSHRLIGSGALHPKPTEALAFRLRALAASLRQVFIDYAPQVVAVEGVFSKINPRAALQLTHARGVALLLAAEHGVAPVEYAPATVKAMIAGHGRAEKEQVARMVQSLLQVQHPFATGDESDALAIALCSALQQNFARAARQPPRVGEQ